MKAGYCLPSGNYNIVLSEDELSQLLKTGHVTIHMSRVPCTTSRLVLMTTKEKWKSTTRNQSTTICSFTSMNLSPTLKPVTTMYNSCVSTLRERREVISMAQKRIRMVRTDILNCKVRLLYDDGSQGELDMTKAKVSTSEAAFVVGMTLKQAKIRLGIKS